MQTEPSNPFKLSKRALALWNRLQDGKFYPAYSDKTPKAMQELIDKGIVRVGARIISMGAFYVPLGTTTPIQERTPRQAGREAHENLEG